MKFGSYERTISSREQEKDTAVERAEEATEAANEKMTRESHEAAAKAHREAVTHYKAESSRAAYHTDMAEGHDYCATRAS